MRKECESKLNYLLDIGAPLTVIGWDSRLKSLWDADSENIKYYIGVLIYHDRYSISKIWIHWTNTPVEAETESNVES